MTHKPTVLIIGAGLCGLTTGIALRKFGWSVVVAEQAPQLGEVGAGLTLSRGVMRCLDWLDLLPVVEARSEMSVSLPFLHYQTGALLRAAAAAPSGVASKHAARQIHRADLHALLVEALRQCGGEIRLDHRLTALYQDQHSVRAEFANREPIDAALVLGTDGVRSVAREAIKQSRGPAVFSGHVAFRCLVPGDIAKPYMGAGRGAVYVGPGCTLNRYSLRQGQVVNCVGLTNSSDWREEGWSTRASNDEFLQHFADWHADVTGLIRVAPPQGIIKWALFEHQPHPGWSSGRIALAGDAAHPMLPFLGLGAAMAIEDAVILAQTLSAFDDHHAALQRYEALRLPRTTLIFEQTKRQGQLLQSQDPESYGKADSPAHNPALFDFDPVLSAA